MQQLRVIISGGGTGGHIFPAIAIANAIKKQVPQAEFLFVGAEGKMEMEKVPAAGYSIEGLKIAGLQRKLTVKNLSFPFKLIGSLIKAKKILKSFKPHIAIGVGGYASGPMLQVAAGKGIPTLIQEQNSFPGITNRLLAKKVDKICVAYDGLEKFFPKEKIIMTGNPVRQEVVNLEGKKPRGVEYFGIDPNKPTLLIVGGSLGARTINESVKASIDKLKSSGFQVLWQTGKLYKDEAKAATEGIEQIKAHEFITKMDLAYAVADVVISRAGAIAVSELCLVRKPVIMVPSPNVAEDHQTKNALALVNHGAAVLVKDSEAREKLIDEAIALMNDAEKQEKLIMNIAKLGLENAADTIASIAINMATKSEKRA